MDNKIINNKGNVGIVISSLLISFSFLAGIFVNAWYVGQSRTYIQFLIEQFIALCATILTFVVLNSLFLYLFRNSILGNGIKKGYFLIFIPILFILFIIFSTPIA